MTCFHVFEHLYQPMAVLEKVAKWLKPGGIFYLMVPEYRFRGSKDFWQLLVRWNSRAIFIISRLNRSQRWPSRRIGRNVAYTGREVFIESSVRYMIDDMMRRFEDPVFRWPKQTLPAFPFGLYERHSGSRSYRYSTL